MNKYLGFVLILLLMSMPAMAVEVFQVCYDFTCRTERTVKLHQNEWLYIQNLFKPTAKSPFEERQQVQLAISWMEEFVGRYTPTHRDLARNYTHAHDDIKTGSGQMDCIDESINTTTYLRLFEKNHLLTYHEVMDRAYRRAFWNQHWAGRIREQATGNIYIVDSWFKNNGELPYVLPNEAWSDLSVLRNREKQDSDQPEVVWNRK